MATKFTFDPTNRVVHFVDHVPRIEDRLPTAIYSLQMEPTGELYLETVEEFGVPTELFGKVLDQATRIVSTFNARSGTTGLLLTGEKGSGKTLLGKIVARRLMDEQDMPVIIVNMPVSGDSFSIFLQKIGRPVTLFFDEFEKVYSKQEYQNGLLTLLDGVLPVKMMAIITSNDSGKLTDPLLNRPGRIYYKVDYHGLEYDFIMEYTRKKLIDHKHLDSVSRLAALTDLNFDQLQALIGEMNHYDESVEDAIQMLNISTERGGFGMRILGANVAGTPVNADQLGKIFNDEGLDFSDDEPLVIPIKEPNPKGVTYGQWGETRSSHDEYEVAMAFTPNPFRGLGHRDPRPLEFLPRLLKFGTDTNILVDRSGNITLVNDGGDSVTMKKPAKINYKAF